MVIGILITNTLTQKYYICQQLNVDEKCANQTQTQVVMFTQLIIF